MCRYQAESFLQPHIKRLEKNGIADILVSGRFGMTFLYFVLKQFFGEHVK